MIEQKLIDYIKETKKQGFSDKEIRKVLLKAGWKKQDIRQGFKVVGEVKPKKPSPKWLVPVVVIVGIVVLGLVAWGVYLIFESFPEPTPGPATCVDKCGDGVCDEVVCQAIGCSCAETPETCSEDCLPR